MFTTEVIARCAGSCKLKSDGRDGVTAGGVAGAAAAGGEGCGVCGTSEVFAEQPPSCMPSRMIPPASGGVIRRPSLQNIKDILLRAPRRSLKIAVQAMRYAPVPTLTA